MPPRDDNIVKHLAAALAIAVAFYILCFSWIEHRRAVHGPWVLDFRADHDGHPSLEISEPALRLSQTILFSNARVAPDIDRRLTFAEETTNNIPFGQVVFQDPTFLPGTLTMELFGHQVEFLPRVIIVDKKEHAWEPGGRLVLSALNSPP